MTKESFILWWFYRNGVNDWAQRIIDGKIIFTFRWLGKVVHIEYDPVEIDPALECDLRQGAAITYFGSVEDCLKMLKRSK